VSEQPALKRSADREPAVEKALGSSVAFLVIPGRSILAIVPFWAVLCGAWMGHAQVAPVPHEMRAQTLLALLLVVVLVGVLWSTWRALLVELDWEDTFRRYPLPAPRLISGLPYTTPWSPVGRLVSRSNQLRHWSRDVPLEVRSAWHTLLVLPALILALSALAGWKQILLSLAALALSLIERRVARGGDAHIALRAGMQVGLGWLAGHAVVAPLSWTAAALACCFAIAYQGALGLSLAPLKPGSRDRSLLFLHGGQAAALCLLTVLARPLTAAFAGFLLAPQWLLLPGLKTEHTPEATRDTSQASAQTWYLQRVLPLSMVAMLAAAWAPR
jgi:hypothetical protein